MRLFDKIRSIRNKAIRPVTSAGDEEILEWLGISKTPKQILSEVTYLLRNIILICGRLHMIRPTPVRFFLIWKISDANW